MDSSQVYLLNGNNLTLKCLQQIIKGTISVDLDQSTWGKIEKTRQMIKDMMAEPNKIVYGINTGFGLLADKIIPKEQRKILQKNLIISHSVGVGNNIPINTVRVMMILRINTLAKNRSGVSRPIIQAYLKAFRIGFVPLVPEQGTVGASGDLAPLAHLALGMLGLGQAWDKDSNSYQDSKVVMQKLGLNPIQLQQKEGLGLINGTQFISGVLCQVLFEFEDILHSSIIILALAVEIFGVDYKYFSDKMIQLHSKTNKNLGWVLKQVKEHLNESEASQMHKNRHELFKNTNVPQSLLHGCECLASALTAYQFCKKIVQQQINGAADNPLVYSKQDGFQEDKLISAGNFHGEYIAKASDYIGIALFNIGKYSEARTQRYVNGKISHLPFFLTKHPGVSSGFMMAQYTTAALLSESKILVKPASVDSIPTSAGQQDHVSMGGFAARKAKLLIKNISQILGIQLMLALQSVDLINLKISNKLTPLYHHLRKHIPFVQEDIYYGPYLSIAQKFVLSGLKFPLDN